MQNSIVNRYPKVLWIDDNVFFSTYDKMIISEMFFCYTDIDLEKSSIRGGKNVL